MRVRYGVTVIECACTIRRCNFEYLYLVRTVLSCKLHKMLLSSKTYICTVVLAGLTPLTASQRACRNTSAVAVLTATAGSQKTLSCTVPAELNILVFYVWEWNQLAANGSVEASLPLTADVSVESTDHSTYTLNTDCTHNGMYQAVYLNNISAVKECVYSCLFVLEVHEVEESVLLDVFSMYRKPSNAMVGGGAQ